MVTIDHYSPEYNIENSREIVSTLEYSSLSSFHQKFRQTAYSDILANNISSDGFKS